MKNRKIILTMAFLAMACFIVTTVPVVAQAQEVDCIGILSDPVNHPQADMDADGDGLNNLMECDGFMQSDGEYRESCIDRNEPNPQATRIRCFDSALRQEMVDPETKDIFVMLVKSEDYVDPDGTHTSFIKDPNGNFLLDPLVFVKNFIGNGGLGLTVHLIEPNPTNILRNITPDPLDANCRTKAIKLTESLEVSPVNGIGSVGTPMDRDDMTIFTRSIVDLVNREYSEDRPDVWIPYIMHTFAHELTHSLTEYEPPSNKDGFHLPGGSEWIMERFVVYKYSKKDGYTTFYTGTVFNANTQAGIEFYEQ